MAKTTTVRKIIPLCKKLKLEGKTTVLVGGCFDILHPGHVIFLEKAKQAGDILIVILESDEKIKKLKGVNRPVHNQKERAKILSALQAPDYVVMLPFMKSEDSYDKLVKQIRPDIIALTQGYKDVADHKRAAKAIQAKLKYVTKLIGNFSTSKIVK